MRKTTAASTGALEMVKDLGSHIFGDNLPPQHPRK